MKKLHGTLTNREIDHYALSGHYGQEIRHRWIDGIRQGKIKTLRKEILEGAYGPEAQTALKERTKTPRRSRKTTQEQGLAALKALGLEHLLD